MRSAVLDTYSNIKPFFAGDVRDDEISEQGVNAMVPIRPTICTQSIRVLTLRAWQIRNKISTNAMQDFIKIAPSFGLTDLPSDWRSVIRLDKRLHHSTNVSEVVEVCSSCFLHRFPPEAVSNAPKCSYCSYSRLFCPRCEYRCILGSSIGNKSRKYIAHCMACGANSGVKVTIRSYIFDIAEHLSFLFSQQKKALSLLQPFVHESEKLFSLECPVTGRSSERVKDPSFVPAHGWLDKWRTICKSSTFFKELWHGERFFNHSIFEEHGMRSVLFEVSLDWFPPHKDKQKYSVGVLSCCPANLSMQERSDLSNIFVLAVIEGPSEPVHTLALLQPVFKKFASLYANGLKVFDSITNTSILVHATVGLCVGDTPATAKLGAFIGHSAYMPCFRCCYKACLCGCKFDTDDGRSRRCTWNNESLLLPSSNTVPPRLDPGRRDDEKKKKGEHMSFIESVLIGREQLRSDVEIRRDQVRIGLFMWTPGYVKAEYKRMKSEFRSTCVSPLTIMPSPRFNIVQDMCLDGMHNLFKGIVLRLIELTFDTKHDKHPFNLNNTKNNMGEFADRMRRFRWSTRDSAPQRLHKSTGGLKAAEIWFFVRVQCLIALRDLIPTNAYIIWTLMVKLVCPLMHTHVSKAWIVNDNGATSLHRTLKTFYERYLDYYGKCHMPYNFHMLLHCRIDCIDWSSLRSHSTFKFERLYHELIGAPRSNGSNKVTQSIVRAATELRSRYATTTPVVSANEGVSWPPSLPSMQDIPCLHDICEVQNVKVVRNCTGQYGGMWKLGDLITVIDHSTGPPIYIGGSLACTIEAVLLTKMGYIALLYPVQDPPIRTRLALGSFRLGNRGTILPSKFTTVNLTKVLEHVHVCHVARYDDARGPTVFIPLCGPLPQAEDE